MQVIEVKTKLEEKIKGIRKRERLAFGGDQAT